MDIQKYVSLVASEWTGSAATAPHQKNQPFENLTTASIQFQFLGNHNII
jgi:hypothetical protein